MFRAEHLSTGPVSPCRTRLAGDPHPPNSDFFALSAARVPSYQWLPATANVVNNPPNSDSVAIHGSASLQSDGFVVLPNGNFLINDADATTTYREYSSVTGDPTGFAITVPGNPANTTGVDTDGQHLFFVTDFGSSLSGFTETDLSGNLVAFSTYHGPTNTTLEDISLIQPLTPPPPPAVPEPSTLALFGLGTVSLLGRAWRRRR